MTLRASILSFVLLGSACISSAANEEPFYIQDNQTGELSAHYLTERKYRTTNGDTYASGKYVVISPSHRMDVEFEIQCTSRPQIKSLGQFIKIDPSVASGGNVHSQDRSLWWAVCQEYTSTDFYADKLVCSADIPRELGKLALHAKANPRATEDVIRNTNFLINKYCRMIVQPIERNPAIPHEDIGGGCAMASGDYRGITVHWIECDGGQ